jgi:hypothetical protein
LVGSTLFGGWRRRETLTDFTGQFADDCDPWNWADGPLYRRRDNLAMLGGGPEKLMRMSTRCMW